MMGEPGITIKKGMIKALTLLCGIALLAGCLTGCGNQAAEDASGSSIASSHGEESVAASSSSVDIESLLQAATIDESNWIWAGSQYVGGEAYTIWRSAGGEEDFSQAQDIYIKDTKGINTKVVSGAPGEYTDSWYYTPKGHCFAVSGNRLARIEADGSETYNVVIGSQIQDICRMEDGRLLLVIQESSGSYYLADVNEDNGEFEIVEGLDFGRDTRTYITQGENGLLLLNSKGFWNLNPDTGEMTEETPMSEYDIRLPYTITDFRMLGAGSVEFLENNNVTEIVHPKDIEKYREVVTVQCRYEDSWLKAMLKEFNNNNYQYYAEIITLSISDGQWEAELANGGGADLISGDCIASHSHYVDMGYLEDLTPYMAHSGMDVSDYFPITFELGKREDSVYSANLYLTMSGYRIKEEVLGSRVQPDVETLIDKLLYYEEPSILNEYWTSQNVLTYLLSGSEDLHGVIDWENKTCDFRSDFFYKVLEVSELYGDDGSGLPAVGENYTQNAFYNYINEEQLELSGEVYLGYLFDDGCYPWMSGGTNLAMNSNSDCKDGAWAVLEYLLSEKAQTQEWLTDDDGKRLWLREYPVNVQAFEAVVQLELEETSYVYYELPKTGVKCMIYKGGDGYPSRQQVKTIEEYQALYNLTETDIEEIRNLMYEVRYRPAKAAEVLEFVYEEAAKYFSGDQSLDETCETIQKRAREYLDGYEE